MKFIPTELKEVIIVEPDVWKDDRGFFLETYHAERYARGAIRSTFVQDNHSRSVKGTLRGLHAQWKSPQGKLLRVLYGSIFDVAVDIRRGSPTFLRWVKMSLSSDNCHQVYVPPGFAHGFYVTSEYAEVEYKCTDYYDPQHELRIRWDDPAIGIDWPVADPILSEKDRAARPIAELQEYLPAYEPGAE